MGWHRDPPQGMPQLWGDPFQGVPVLSPCFAGGAQMRCQPLPPTQVGFRKGPGPLLSRLASRSQLELALGAIAVTLALLLGAAVVALAVQYSRGRGGV